MVDDSVGLGIRCGAVWFAAGLFVGCAQFPPAASVPAREATELEGYWEAEGESGTTSVSIDGDSLYFYARPDHQFDTTFRLVADTDPQQFRATILDTPRTSGSKGEVVWVVYKVEDETLTMAVFDGANGAPASFTENIDRYEFKKVGRHE